MSDDNWISISDAYARARLIDILEEARKALRAGSSAATMEALITIKRIAVLELDRRGLVDEAIAEPEIDHHLVDAEQ
jgi:hypothetical protein